MLAKLLTTFFKREAKRIADEAVEHFEQAHKADTESWQPNLDSWVQISTPVAEALQDEFMNAVGQFVNAGINLTPDALLALDQRAQAFAHERGAELVGMRLVDGEFVPNPNPQWAITETTRETIRGLVEKAFAEGCTPQQLRDAIESSVMFSRQRAMTVARTELARAHVRGSLEGASQAGVTKKRWLINPESPTAYEDDCGANQDQGAIPLASPFQSGDDGPPQHPNCECTLIFEFEPSPSEAQAE